MNHRLPLLASCLVTMTLAACVSQPDRPVVPAPEAHQARFTAPPRGAAAVPSGRWWQQPGHAGYSDFLDSVIAGNVQLQATRAARSAARSRLAATRAEAGFSLESSAGATLVEGDSGQDSATASLDLSRDMDISGRRDALIATAEAELAQAGHNESQAEAELARDVLLALIDYAEAVQQLVLSERQVDTAGVLLKLTELRFVQGQASSVDVLQQRDQLASLRQQVPALQRAEHRARNRLQQLSGKAPGEPPAAPRPDAIPTVSGTFAPLRPGDLLDTRPDLRAAGAALRAADQRFEAALRDRLPELRFSTRALARLAAGDLTSLLSATLEAAFQLFDGGRQVAVIGEARSRLRAAGLEYLQAWLLAVEETDTLLLDEVSLNRELALSRERLATARELLHAVQRRYERGVSDYLPVLAALSGLQQQERDLIDLEAGLARTRTRLHYSLGAMAPAEQ